MKRKIFCIILSALMIMSFASCTKKTTKSSSKSDKKSSKSYDDEDDDGEGSGSGKSGGKSGKGGGILGGGGKGGSDDGSEIDPEDEEQLEALIEEQGLDIEPDEISVKSICQLATLECYFNNVAKSTKKGGTGVVHLGEKDRDFWVEYSAVATLGVDASQVSIEIVDNIIYVYMPEAKVLEKVEIVPDSYNKDSVIQDIDGKVNSNDITAADITTAVNESLEDLQEEVENNTTLLDNAQDRAKVLVKNYIEKINEYSDKQYIVMFKDPSEKSKVGN